MGHHTILHFRSVRNVPKRLRCLSERSSDNAGRFFVKFYIVEGVKVRVTFTLEQATKAPRGSSGIVLFL